MGFKTGGYWLWFQIITTHIRRQEKRQLSKSGSGPRWSRPSSTAGSRWWWSGTADTSSPGRTTDTDTPHRTRAGGGQRPSVQSIVGSFKGPQNTVVFFCSYLLCNYGWKWHHSFFYNLLRAGHLLTWQRRSTGSLKSAWQIAQMSPASLHCWLPALTP